MHSREKKFIFFEKKFLKNDTFSKYQTIYICKVIKKHLTFKIKILYFV